MQYKTRVMNSVLYIMFTALLNFLIGRGMWNEEIEFGSLPILSWYLLLSIVSSMISSIPVAAMIYNERGRQYAGDAGVKASLVKAFSNIHNLLLIGFIGALFNVTIVLTPIYFLAISSLMVSGYRGFDSVHEAAKQMVGRRKYLGIVLPYMTIAFAMTILFLLSSETSPTYPDPNFLMGIASLLVWWIYSWVALKVSQEYITWGLKRCVYCSEEDPLESVYCAHCGEKLS